MQTQSRRVKFIFEGGSEQIVQFGTNVRGIRDRKGNRPVECMISLCGESLSEKDLEYIHTVVVPSLKNGNTHRIQYER